MYSVYSNGSAVVRGDHCVGHGSDVTSRRSMLCVLGRCTLLACANGLAVQLYMIAHVHDCTTVAELHIATVQQFDCGPYVFRKRCQCCCGLLERRVHVHWWVTSIARTCFPMQNSVARVGDTGGTYHFLLSCVPGRD